MIQSLVSGVLSQGQVVFFVSVFLSVALATIVVGTLTTSWIGIRRRAAAGANIGAPSSLDGLPGEKLLSGNKDGYLGGLLPSSEAEKSELRKFLNMAGHYGRSAPTIYQLIRIATAVWLGMMTAMLYGRLFPSHPLIAIVGVTVMMTALGYYLPKSIVSLQRDGLVEEHRQGFPDFLDLLIICVEAGIGIDSAIERVSQDLGKGYPSLARNLKFMTVEMRAGRSTRDSLDNLALRLGIDEAKSFATLLRQSEELGSSLVQSLRVYSDEMRAKRLARAEEKAHALPAKLVIPLGLFIFPVILGITMIPVAIKIFSALKI
jgi:tight adherence protein C